MERKGCAISQALVKIAESGGNSTIGTGKKRPRTYTCQVESCPVTAFIENLPKGEFHVYTQGRFGIIPIGSCLNRWVGQAITIEPLTSDDIADIAILKELNK